MSWKLVAVVLFSLLAIAGPLALGQQDRPPEGGRDRRLESDKAAAARRRAQNVATLRAMQGGWQLIELRITGLDEAGRQDVGFMVVSSEFASLEMHSAYFDDQGVEEESYLQTGTYRLNFNIYGDLTAKLLIGSVDDGYGKTWPREPGLVSVYEVRVEDGILTMVTEAGSRFLFQKMAEGNLTRLIYEDTDWLPRTTEASVDKGEKSAGKKDSDGRK